MRNHLVHGALVVLTVTLTAGCAATVSGHGIASMAPRTSASSSADFPSAPTSTTPPQPTPTAPSTSAAPLASRDITDVHWRIPRGFVRGVGYHPVTPLESHWRAGYLVPSNERAGRDVISIVLYRLPSYIPVNSIYAQKVRVRYYNDHAGARTQSGLHVLVLDGWPAIQENAIEQRIYRYAAWFVFSKHHLVEVSCQVDQQVNKIARACGSVLKSLTLS